MSIRNLMAQIADPVWDIHDAAADSDGANGSGVDIDGWNKALVLVNAKNALDSDATVAVNVQSAALPASDAAASDWSNIDSGNEVTLAPGDSTSSAGIQTIAVDFLANSLTTGAIRTNAVASASDTADVSSVIILHQANGKLPSVAPDATM